jgi:hypothetical protein
MNQTTFASTGFELVTKRTRKLKFLDEMYHVMPWSELTGLIKPFAPASKTGRQPFPIATMLRIHLVPQLSDFCHRECQFHQAGLVAQSWHAH